MPFDAGDDIYGFYEPGQDATPIDKSPLRLPNVRGDDEIENYNYSPISAGHQIRIVELLPPTRVTASRESMEFLRCKLNAHILKENPEYEALSYTWGSMDRSLPISVVDEEGDETALLATLQLMMALRRLRLQSTSRFLWIDQLCIDQGNDAEKGPQIQLMGAIYRKAKRVVIWLGEDHQEWVADTSSRMEPHTDLLIGLINEFKSSANYTVEEDARLAAQLVEAFPCHSGHIRTRRRNAIWEFLNRPWFRRASVFQEVSLAKDILIQYGPLEVKFLDLKRVFDAVYKVECITGAQRRCSLALNTGGFEMMQIMHGTSQRLLEPDTTILGSLKGNVFLSTLFKVLRRVKATERRDLIYAFLAFQEDEAIEATEETLKWSEEELWRFTTERIIKSSNSLDVFAALSGGEIKRPLNLPSWVPYWADCFPYSRPIALPTSRFDACRGRKHVWIDSEDPSKLRVRGKIIDRISQTVLPFGKFMAWKHNAWLFLIWQCTCQDIHRWLYENRVKLGDQLQVKLSTSERDLMRTVLADGAMGAEQPLRCVYEMLESNKMADQGRDLRATAGEQELNDEKKRMIDNYTKLESLAFIAETKHVFNRFPY